MSTSEVNPSVSTTYAPPESTSELRKRLKASARAAAIPQPLAGVQPVEIYLIDEDPINPGFQSSSERYKKREQPIRESYDILGRIVYPCIIVSKDDGTGRFWMNDGHGRMGEAKARGQKAIDCIIFPQLTPSQRIVLREVLNAAQEPFDSALVVKDIQKLAEERGLNIRENSEDLEALLAELPTTMAEDLRKKFKVLAQWPKDIADKISVDVYQRDDEEASGTIGLRKLYDLNVVLKKLRNHHAAVLSQYPGDKLNRRLFDLYHEGAFRDGGRSQDGIARCNMAIKEADDNEPLVADFMKGNLKLGEFIGKLEAKQQAKQKSESQLMRVCNELNGLLAQIYPGDLETKERFALKTSYTLIGAALAETAKN